MLLQDQFYVHYYLLSLVHQNQAQRQLSSVDIDNIYILMF